MNPCVVPFAWLFRVERGGLLAASSASHIAGLDNAIAILELMRPVLPANLLGTPAAVIRAGMIEGLPVGVQVMGGKYTELAAWPSPRRSSSDSARSPRSTRSPMEMSRSLGRGIADIIDITRW